MGLSLVKLSSVGVRLHAFVWNTAASFVNFFKFNPPPSCLMLFQVGFKLISSYTNFFVSFDKTSQLLTIFFMCSL